MNEFVRMELMRRGYSYRYHGTGYIEKAANAVIHAWGGHRPMLTKEVYPTIAKACNTSDMAVEKAIRDAVRRVEPGRKPGAVIFEIAAVGKAYAD